MYWNFRANDRRHEDAARLLLRLFASDVGLPSLRGVEDVEHMDLLASDAIDSEVPVAP